MLHNGCPSINSHPIFGVRTRFRVFRRFDTSDAVSVTYNRQKKRSILPVDNQSTWEGEFVSRAEILVNALADEVNNGNTDLSNAEERILDFVYGIGDEMLQSLSNTLAEPVSENQVFVSGKIARYKGQQELGFRNRFGRVTRLRRRRYAIEGESKGWYPLDEKLGLDKCYGFSPLMSYLLSYFGAHMPYGDAAKKLTQALGFEMSATAVQGNTEKTEKRIAHHPLRIIPSPKQSQRCQRMIVEVDGTLSPQIHEEEGITGRESLKQKTDYKECNLISIQKLDEKGNQIDRWTGAHYGTRASFEPYASRTGIKMGQLQTEEIVFLGDGAKHNWELQQTHFCGSIPILDCYHAMELLSAFCDTIDQPQRAKQSYQHWETMIYEGQILRVIHEMRDERARHSTNRHEAQKHINYFENNKDRMWYDEYRKAELPIGSGVVEGQCKLVIGKRFKGNGMRWKRADNEAVLDVRLASINGILKQQFVPQSRSWT